MCSYIRVGEGDLNRIVCILFFSQTMESPAAVGYVFSFKKLYLASFLGCKNQMVCNCEADVYWSNCGKTGNKVHVCHHYIYSIYCSYSFSKVASKDFLCQKCSTSFLKGSGETFTSVLCIYGQYQIGFLILTSAFLFVLLLIGLCFLISFNLTCPTFQRSWVAVNIPFKQC